MDRENIKRDDDSEEEEKEIINKKKNDKINNEIEKELIIDENNPEKSIELICNKGNLFHENFTSHLNKLREKHNQVKLIIYIRFLKKIKNIFKKD